MTVARMVIEMKHVRGIIDTIVNKSETHLVAGNELKKEARWKLILGIASFSCAR